MDWNECSEIENLVARKRWVFQYSKIRDTKLCEWVSTFHPQKLTCQCVGPNVFGSYNVVNKVQFDGTGETWAVRFPRGSKYHSVWDEKVEAEVAAINIIRRQTNIPIPEIKAWGLARDNELGLGPFILSAWVDGTKLSEILKSQDKSSPEHMISESITDATIERLWRQIVRFMLELSQFNFDHIGSCTAARRRPLTIKSHHILEAGVEMSCPPDTTFTSSIDYFNAVADHDLRHLHEQLNSVDDEEDARQKFINWHVVRKLVPRFVQSDHGPFKLICDDFGPMNMIVNNADDLQIVAVVDWEWSYAGPQEISWSPPRWLVGQSPTMWVDKGPDDPLLSRYQHYLDILIKVLQEEETKLDCIAGDELPSVLMRRKQQDGSMWFYHIMQEALNGPTTVVFAGLRASVPDYEKLAAAVSKEETEAFVQMKLEHLKRYEAELAEMKRRHPDIVEFLA